MAAILLLITQGLALLPGLIKAGMSIAELIGLLRRVADAGEVTDADWDALHAIEDGLRRKLHSDTE